MINRSLWVPVVVLLTLPARAVAQEVHARTVGVAGGIGLRGGGNTGLCCGPFARDIGALRSLWVGGSLGRRLGPRVNLDASAEWAAEPEYVAAVQGRFAGAPVRGYLATTRMRSVTAAAVMRVRVARSGRALWEAVGGLGLARQMAESRLDSVTFRPQFEAVPSITADVEDTRHRTTSIAGVDVVVPVGRVSFVTQCRLHTQFGAADAVRSDLEAGRSVLRIGMAVRRSV